MEQYSPKEQAQEIGTELQLARRVALAERKLHGYVLPETVQKLAAAFARAKAYLAIEDARARAISTCSRQI